LEIWLRESQLLPPQARDLIWTNVTELLSRPQAGLLSVGLAVALFSASGGMNMTIGALDKVYDLEKGRPFYTQRPRALVMTLVVAILIVTLLVLLPIGTIALNFVERHGHQYISTPLLMTWRIARYPLAGLLMFTVVHVIYHHGPAIRQRFVFFTPGAVFTVAVWIGLGFAFRLYVEKFGRFNETYGTVGGVAVLLLFFYIDALVLLIGAEINSEIDFEVLKVKRGERDFRIAMGATGGLPARTDQPIP
jgi:membrane protein